MSSFFSLAITAEKKKAPAPRHNFTERALFDPPLERVEMPFNGKPREGRFRSVFCET
jgi:hypothetical protein